MTEHEASRTLVKSPPELWAECSAAESLARHLGEFGEIRITKLEPETAVAWEGTHASGTVTLEPSGWGTKVILTASATSVATSVGPGAADEAVPVPMTKPEAGVEPEASEPGPDAVPAVAPEASEPEAAAPPEQIAPPPATVARPPHAAPPPAATIAPPPDAAPPPAATIAPPATKRGLFARLFGFLRPQPPVGDPPAPDPQPQPVAAEPAPEAPAPAAVAAEPVGLEPTPQSIGLEPAPEPMALEPAPEPVALAPEPVALVPEPAREPVATVEPAAVDPTAVLTAALDSLGQAHHRPFSRG